MAKCTSSACCGNSVYFTSVVDHLKHDNQITDVWLKLTEEESLLHYGAHRSCKALYQHIH